VLGLGLVNLVVRPSPLLWPADPQTHNFETKRNTWDMIIKEQIMHASYTRELSTILKYDTIRNLLIFNGAAD
jgi:hypothetical protein